MKIENDPQNELPRSGKAKKNRMKIAPSLFDFISKNVKLVDGELEAVHPSKIKPEKKKDILEISERAEKQLCYDRPKKPVKRGEEPSGRGEKTDERKEETFPGYVIMAKAYTPPELAEDRETAFSKLKNGETLTELEKELISTFPEKDRYTRRSSIDD